jgi:hypothetical protein
MNQAAPPNMNAPPPKKKGNGCAIALMVMVGITFLAAIGFGIAMWRVIRTPEGQQVWKAASGTMKLMQDAQNAPGAKEVAKQGGCQQALVIDTEQMAELVESFTPDAGVKKGMGALEEKTMVTCQVGFARTPPTCEQIARIYVDAAHPKAPFRVTVQQQGSTQRSCERSYDENGAALE